MEYRVRFADDTVMPAGHTWVLCEQQDVTTLYMRRSLRELPLSDVEAVLEAAWLGFAERMALPRVKVSA